jgi:hypothetical protein
LIFIAVSWVAAWVIFSQPAINQHLSELPEQAIQKQVDSGRLTEQQAEQALAMGEKWAGIMQKVGAVLVPVLYGLVTPFLWGLIVWLVGAKVIKGHFSYMKAVEVVGLANMISVLDVIVKTLLIVGFGNLYASPSLVLLVRDFDPQNLLHRLFGAVNVMTFWLLLVCAIGLVRLSGTSLARAVAWVFGIWVAYTALIFGLVALVQTAVRRIGS